MEITPIPFSCNTEVVSQKAFNDHVKLYHGYVDKVNEITKKLAASPDLAAANAVFSNYRGLKKGETFALNGVILHELYFRNLVSERSNIGPKTLKMLDRYFGSFDNWKNTFTASAKSARGWCITAFEQRTATCRNIVLDSHDEGLVCGFYPLILLDMYEHAYFEDYAADKGAYIEKFIAGIPWSVIEKRVSRL